MTGASMVLAGRPRLHATPLAPPGVSRTIALAHHKEYPLSHAAAAFQATLMTYLEQAEATGTAPRLPIAEPFRFVDCGWVANRWCELLPLPPELKQRLMELGSTLMRLELVSDLLARTGIAKE